MSQLQNTGLGLRIFFDEHGRTATNLLEIQTDGVIPFALSYSKQMIYRTEGTNWSVRVVRTPQLPGDYLLTENGNIFFNETRPARTNDVNLVTQSIPFPRKRF